MHQPLNQPNNARAHVWLPTKVLQNKRSKNQAESLRIMHNRVQVSSRDSERQPLEDLKWWINAVQNYKSKLMRLKKHSGN
jgi:hypothetical protein